MRISITAEKQVLPELEASLQAHEIKTEPAKHAGDRSEQAFGIAEVATLVAIAVGTAKLIEALIAVARHVKKGKTQKLHLKSALGAVTLDLRPEITAEELVRSLKTLGPSP